MASKSSITPLLLVAVLVSVFAAAAATGPYCYPGMGIPRNPLEGCREYVTQQICGVGIVGPPVSTEPGNTPWDRCCRELSNASQHCRCEALCYFIGWRSDPNSGMLKDLPECPKEAQRDFAKVLVTPGHYNMMTVHNAPYCLGLDFFAGVKRSALLKSLKHHPYTN
ncbi:alpha-amylase/trypsin inhibitor CM2-like [Triticum dicoccoides]|uniref:alpha-amylase/trypsin inhibitor CM2-like n=1 Tax=Triticum dicoccoides TaxID=85692 RepID=UPI001891C485|nr:alpha-amylase/trypsin inhibitor CM2-like [Triticum dicoccoides]